MLLSISVAVVVPKTSSFCVDIFSQWKLHGIFRLLSGRGIIAATRNPCKTGTDVHAPEGDTTWRQAL